MVGNSNATLNLFKNFYSRFLVLQEGDNVALDALRCVGRRKALHDVADARTIRFSWPSLDLMVVDRRCFDPVQKPGNESAARPE